MLYLSASSTPRYDFLTNADQQLEVAARCFGVVGTTSRIQTAHFYGMQQSSATRGSCSRMYLTHDTASLDLNAADADMRVCMNSCTPLTE
jgi:hypothetical protein